MRLRSSAPFTIWVARAWPIMTPTPSTMAVVNSTSGPNIIDPMPRLTSGVDISHTKDFADFNHTNFVAPATNQLYIGWTADGEWCNYTVNVKKAGKYKIVALYGNAANTITFSINNQPATECKLPLATGSMHIWNQAEIGTITFPEAGLQVL